MTLHPQPDEGRRNPTKRQRAGEAASGEADGLTDAQRRAVAILTGGGSVTNAATAVGVTRQTVSGWANRDPAFIAAWNVARAELAEAVAAKLLAAATDAGSGEAFPAETVAAAARAGNVKAAVYLLDRFDRHLPDGRGAGRPAAVDAAAVADELALIEREAASRVASRRSFADMAETLRF